MCHARSEVDKMVDQNVLKMSYSFISYLFCVNVWSYYKQKVRLVRKWLFDFIISSTLRFNKPCIHISCGPQFVNNYISLYSCKDHSLEYISLAIYNAFFIILPYNLNYCNFVIVFFFELNSFLPILLLILFITVRLKFNENV